MNKFDITITGRRYYKKIEGIEAENQSCAIVKASSLFKPAFITIRNLSFDINTSEQILNRNLRRL